MFPSSGTMTSLQHQLHRHVHSSEAPVSRRCFQTHQLSSDGQTGTVLFRQFNLDGFGVLGGPQSPGQVLRGHLQTDLVVLGGEAFHLVLIKEVGLRGDRAELEETHHEKQLQD